MDRRNFFKISGITAGGIALESCGHPETQLIRFLPEDALTPGQASWTTSLCRQCKAGCGVRVRLMDGEMEVVRNGERGLLARKLAKKLEGNPDHPISGGKLCARGQAGLQVTYNPDRIRGPLKRSGPRGSGKYNDIGWDEALEILEGNLRSLQRQNQERSLAFLSGPLRGRRSALLDRFLAAFGSAGRVEYECFGDGVLRRANGISFDREALPTYDIGNCNYLVSFGADFLGTWLSPVAQAAGFGQMRQGRPGRRGKFVQVESRMTPTGGKADEWIPLRPGTDGVLALGIAHVIITEGLARPAAAGRAGSVIEEWSQGLPSYTPEKVEEITGVRAERIVRLAREIALHLPAVIIIGGPSLAHTNGLFHALAANALNALLGSVGSPGGINFTPSAPLGSLPPLPRGSGPAAGGPKSVKELADQVLSLKPFPVKTLLLAEANPVFSAPAAWKLREALEQIPFIAGFGSFIDETSSMADLILPDHTALESWQEDVPETGTTRATVSLAAPAMKPLFDTRATPDVFLELGKRLGGRVEAALPWENYEELLKETLGGLLSEVGASIESGDLNEFWSKAQEQGGWWKLSGEARSPSRASRRRSRRTNPVAFEEPEFDGREGEFPFYFLPFASQGSVDGRHANLPWLQEMPELLSTVRWGSWVEINPHTAERLGIQEGDLIAVESSRGRVEAPALIFPGIAPDTVAMPAGQGHQSYGRYASDRGANPASLLAPLTEAETGELAWAGTRVRLTKVGKGRLIKAAGSLEERPAENFPR